MDTEENRPDFRILPEVTLVEVLSYLSLEDRYHASCTCHNFYSAFNHPSLWRYAELKLIGPHSNYYHHNPFFPKKYHMMVKKFGRYFQNLILSISGFIGTFSDELNEIILELGKQCRLESLTLEIGQLTSRFHLYGMQPLKSDMVALLSFVEHAFRLKSFHLISWPMFPSTVNNDDQNIFEALMRNEKLKDLEELTLFWCKETKWTERMPILPDPEYTLTMARHFRNLTHLGLRSLMLSDSVIEELSSVGRTRLKLLQIFVNYSGHYTDFQIPKISSQVWKNFRDANPSVEVECTIMPRVPNVDLADMLKPETPLSTINFMKYSRCDGMLITSLADRFGKRLRKFVSYCDSSTNFDEELIDLVQRSPNLNEFVYHGQISCPTVARLAELHGDQWKRFEVFLKTLTVSVEMNGNDDVIAQNEEGQYYLVDMMRFHQPEELIDMAVNQMTEKVSNALGYSWSPQTTQN